MKFKTNQSEFLKFLEDTWPPEQVIHFNDWIIRISDGAGKRASAISLEGIWEEASFGFIKYYPDSGDDLYRRSLYTFWRRIVGPPVFFDSGARQVCEVKSLRTNTPLHALTTLNDTTYAEAARGFGQRALNELNGSDSERLRKAFRMATSRYPNRSELGTLNQALGKYRKHFSKNRDAAMEVATAGESTRDESLDPVDHAAWSTVGLMLLNLDETLTKE